MTPMKTRGPNLTGETLEANFEVLVVWSGVFFGGDVVVVVAVVVVVVVQKTTGEVVANVYVCDFVRALRVLPKLNCKDFFFFHLPSFGS